MFPFRLLAAMAVLLAVFLSSSVKGAEFKYHGQRLDLDKAVARLVELAGIQTPSNWGQLSPRGRIDIVAEQYAVKQSGLLSADVEIFDLCVAAIGAKSGRKYSELSAEIAIAAISKGDIEGLYGALREYKHTTAGIRVYQQLRDAVLASGEPMEVRRFLLFFPRGVDASAAHGVLFLLNDERIKSLAQQKRGFELPGVLHQSLLGEDVRTGLGLLSLERMELAAFAHVNDLNNALPEKPAVFELERAYQSSLNFVRGFPESSKRVEKVVVHLERALHKKLEIARLKLDPMSSDLADRISAFVLQIGVDGFRFFDDAMDSADLVERTVGLVEAHARYKYIVTLTSKMSEQFNGNPAAIAAVTEAVNRSNTLQMIVRVRASVQQCDDALKSRGEAVRKLDLSVSGLATTVEGLRVTFGAGFNSIDIALMKLKTETVELNTLASNTLADMKSGFTDVSEHIQSCNTKLDVLTQKLQSTNEKLVELARVVADGFAGINSTYYDVAAKDFGNARYWEVREEAARKYIKEKAVVIRKAFFGILGLLECEVKSLCQIPYLCDSEDDDDCGLSVAMTQRCVDIKRDVYATFMDDFGMVCNRKDDGVKRVFIDKGDCAWRTSVFLACLAMEGDNEGCRRLLTSLGECWYDGSPHRTPDRSVDAKTEYSTDQFVPHLAALYLCFRFGDAETRQKAVELTKRFVDKLAVDAWKLSEDEYAHFNAQRMIGRYFVMLVTKEMGLDRLWRDSTDAALYGFYREGWFAAAELRAAEAAVSTPEEPTSFHNLFWEVLLINYCEGDSDELTKLKCKLALGAKEQDMALFMWLGHRGKAPCGWLRDWPGNWSVRDYVWQRSRHQNNSEPNAGEMYPRLDYLVLGRLMEKGRP